MNKWLVPFPLLPNPSTDPLLTINFFFQIIMQVQEKSYNFKFTAADGSGPFLH